MLQFFTVTSYMLISKLQCSIILFHHVHLVLLGSIFDISDQLDPSASLTVFLYVIFRDVPFRSRSDDPLCTSSSFILVYILDPLLYLTCKHYLLSLSMGMPTSDSIFISYLFHWLGRLKSGELLSGLVMIPSIHLIHFGNHVPLLN